MLQLSTNRCHLHWVTRVMLWSMPLLTCWLLIVGCRVSASLPVSWRVHTSCVTLLSTSLQCSNQWVFIIFLFLCIRMSSVCGPHLLHFIYLFCSVLHWSTVSCRCSEAWSYCEHSLYVWSLFLLLFTPSRVPRGPLSDPSHDVLYAPGTLPVPVTSFYAIIDD